MKKRKSFLGLYLIISLVLIIAAVVVSLTAGINLGTDMVGGTQFEVTLASTEKLDEHVSKVKDVLKDNKVSVETILVEDKNIDKVILVRLNQKDVKNVDQIKSDIQTALSLESVDSVSDFSEISGSLTNKAVIWASVTIVCLLLAIFVGFWVRYKITAGLSVTFTVLHTLLLGVAVLILTRLPINYTSVIILAISTMLTLFALTFFLEKIKENKKHNGELETSEIIVKSRKETWLPLTVLASMIALVAIVFMFVPVTYVLYSALTIVVALVVAAYSYMFVGVDFHGKLLEIKEANDKLKLSRNNSPAPSKVKETKKKVEEPKAEVSEEKKTTKKKTNKKDKVEVREKKVKPVDKIQV